MKFPKEFLISSNIYGSKYSPGSEYILIHTKATFMYSFSRQNFSFKGLKNRSTEYKKYRPPSMTLFLYSKLMKELVKKPLDPS